MRQYSDLEQRLLNDFQQALPLSPTPFSDLAKELGVYETTVLENLKRLQGEGVISRVGAVFKPNRVGVSTLAAMAVDETELADIAAIVSEFAEVNHNYERFHHFNLWFVVVATDAVSLKNTLDLIEASCGYSVLDLPMLQDYFIDLGFDLKWT
jgi:DNA-binding Lrp family transcriptional regulator